MASLLDLFFKSKAPLTDPMVCVVSETSEPIDYSAKEDRSEKINYQGVGRTKYAAGTPPTALYTTPGAAVRAYPIVYGCVTAISDAVAALNVKIYEIKGGQRTEALEHPFYTVFKTPNPFQGSFEFLEQLQQSLDVFGNAFIAKEKVAGTVELYVLNPKYVAIIPDPKIKVKEYRYNINGSFIKYAPEEIIHIKYSDVDDPYFGMPPLTTATDVLTFEKNRLKFANQFFQNGAIPVGVLETEQVLGEIQLKKLRGEWTNLHQGVANAHKVGILQGGLKYRAITTPIKDLDFEGLKQLSKEDILTIFKIPESILGNQTGTGSSEGKSAITAFWRQCIIPRLKRIESGMNRGLSVEMFGTGAFVFEFNLKDVAALQDDKQELADYLQKMVGSSIMTPNEARAVLGLPRVDGTEYADELLVNNSFFGNQNMPVEVAAATSTAGANAEKPAAQPAKPGAAKPGAAAPAAAAKPSAKPAAKPPAKN